MSTYDISLSGLVTQSRRMGAIAQRVANVNTENFAPKDVVSLSRENGGVSSVEISKPDDSLENQMIDMITTKTAYKADAKLIKVQRDMDDALLDIFS